MGVTGPVILPRSFRQASIGVGNAIAKTHALVGLLALLQATNPTQVDVPLLIQLHADQCLASGHVTIRWDENWIEMKPIRYITDQVLSFARTVDVNIDTTLTCPADEVDCEIVSIADATPAPTVFNLAISWQGIRMQILKGAEFVCSVSHSKMLPGRMLISLREPRLKTYGELNKSCWVQLRKWIIHAIVWELTLISIRNCPLG